MRDENFGYSGFVKRYAVRTLSMLFLFTSVAMEPAPARAENEDGASGLNATNAVISSGTYTGEGGGFTQEYADDASANGGAGVSAYGNTIISNGTFSGGDGGYALSFKGAVAADGGSGLTLHGGNSTLYGGTYEGGVAGLVATNPAYAGVAGFDGSGVELKTESGGVASLSILGGDVNDGIKISSGTNSTISLHISTNANVEGSLVKHGAGALGVSDWQAGTLQQIEILDGTVGITNHYVLETGGRITLSAPETEFQALEGMVVDGTLDASAGGVVKIYSNLTVSGTVSGTVEMSSASGNTVVLQSGSNVSGAELKGNGVLDRLQLTQAGTYSAASLGMGSRILDFERVELSSGSDTWQLSRADIARTDFTVDGGAGAGDLLVMAQAGTYDAGDFNRAYNTGFELFGLSAYNDVWVAGGSDASLGYLDARGGIDELDFSMLKVASSEIGATGFYRNFEGIRLSTGNDTWMSTNNYAQLDFVNAGTGVDTLSYAAHAAVGTNALNMGPSAYYRGFEQVGLTSGADDWRITDNDSFLSKVHALGGLDTLSVSDTRGWSVMDAARYTGFETLALSDGAEMSVEAAQPLAFGNIHHAGSTLDIAADAAVVAENYYQDSDSVLRFEASTNDVGSVNAGLQASVASFASNSTFQFYSTVSDFALNSRYTNQVVDAQLLVIGGRTNALDLSALTLDESLLVAKKWYVGSGGNSIFAIFDRRSLLDVSGVESNSTLGSILLEIDGLATEEADQMLTYIDGADMSAAELVRNLSDVYERSIAAPRLTSHQRNEMLRQLLDRTVTFRASKSGKSNPEGPAGPGEEGDGMSGWFKGYGGLGTSTAGDGHYGYDMNLFGSVVGCEKSFGKLLVGLAGGMAVSGMEFENKDSLDAVGYHGSLYASHGVEDLFVESVLSFSAAGLQSASGSRFDVSSGYDSTDISCYLGLGYILDERALYLMPEAAILVSQYSQDGYTDISDSSVPAVVDSYSRLGMQSRLGFSSALRREVADKEILVRARLNWLHEFNATDERVGFKLLGGTEEHSFAVLLPEADHLDMGLSLDLRVNRALTLQTTFDYLFGSQYTAYHFSAGLGFDF